MPRNSWTWKAKDGALGGLLYEPGNWGDLLKALWLTIFVDWSREGIDGGIRRYVDPFAGAPAYPLGAQTKSRFLAAGLAELSPIEAEFLEKGLWPSSASLFRLHSPAPMLVFDADAERLARWRDFPGAVVADAVDGWAALRAEDSLAGSDLVLADPYDFMGEWRENADALLSRAASCTLLLYVYNRSARKAEHFREYRAFRGYVDEKTGGGYLFGRAASDPFLPSCHHEMFLFPSPEVAAGPAFSRLAGALENGTLRLDEAMRRLSVFGYGSRFFTAEMPPMR